jgi:hypothetical protein
MPHPPASASKNWVDKLSPDGSDDWRLGPKRTGGGGKSKVKANEKFAKFAPRSAAQFQYAHQRLSDHLASTIDFQPAGLVSPERCPRLQRLVDTCKVRQCMELGLPSGDKKDWTEFEIDRATIRMAKEHMHMGVSPNPDINLWELVMECTCIKPISDEICGREEYVEALVVVNGLRTLTVGRAQPKNGDFLHTGFLSFYDDGCVKHAYAQHASAHHGAISPHRCVKHAYGDDPAIGCQSVSQINDAQATIYFEFAKVYRKYLAVEDQIAKLLGMHMTLYAQAAEQLESLRYTLLSVPLMPSHCREIFELVTLIATDGP